MIAHESDKKSRPVYGDGIQDVSKQILIGPRDGFSGYLREFSLAPGGHTPYHHHDWYHVVYILEGSGVAAYKDSDHAIKKGSILFIEANQDHGFTNSGNADMKFLCLVPGNGDSYAEED